MNRLDPTTEQLLLQMQYDKLFGEVVLKFEAGKVVLLKKTETIKPPSGRDNRDEEGSEVMSGTHNSRRN